MCGNCVNALDLIVSDGENKGLELQVVSGAHGVKSDGGKNHKHGHESYEHKKDYQNAPDYNGMNPEYTLKGPFMSYSAANNGDYSPIENYSQKENSSYQKAA